MPRHYDVLNEIVLRDDSGRPTTYKVLRGRAHKVPDSNNALIAFVSEDLQHFNAVLCSFNSWFSDWQAEHDFSPSRRSSRAIEVAVPIEVLGRLVTDDFAKTDLTIAAVNIDNIWTPPTAYFRRNSRRQSRSK